MKKTLQDQYLLIKEGKGHKGVFLSEAKRQFPDIVRNAATFNEAAASLITKNIISENVISLGAINSPFEPKKKQSYETAFEAFLAEAKKKENEDEKVKAEEKKVSKKVEEDASHNFDSSDEKNPDNMIFGQIMMGYYAEMKDPKNADKTMQELKDIVFKNLAKDQIYYTKNAQFGVKDLGYTTEAPALGEPKEAKGKYKFSGYGDLKESIEKFMSDVKDAVTKKGDKKFSPEEIKAKLKQKREAELKRRKEAGESLEEITLRKAIQEMIDEELFNSEAFEDTLYKIEQPHLNDKEALDNIQKIYSRHSQGLNSAAQNLQEGVEKDLAAINKEAEHEVLQSKMEKIQALIDKKQSQISRLDEDEDMKDLTDDKKVKEISKDIKALEKAKVKLERLMSKFKGKKPESKKVIDEMDNAEAIVANIAPEYIEDANERLENGEEIDSILTNYQNLSFNDRNHLRNYLDWKQGEQPGLNSELGVEDQY
jgi:hypothetical protein